MKQRTYNLPDETKVCPGCGQEFGPNRWNYASSWAKRVACSPACARKLRAQERRIREERPCVACGARFYPPDDEAKYCSRECYWTAKKGTTATYRPPLAPRTEIPCAGCGTPVSLRPYEVDGSHRARRFCTRDCYTAHMKRHAPDDPHYAFYHSGEWAALRRYVRIRDANTCQRCGLKGDGRKLTVHHMQARTSFERPEEADRPENLQTVCFACHNHAHFGKPRWR